MTGVATSLLIAAAASAAPLVPAMGSARVAELEAKVGAQEARIRALEAQLGELLEQRHTAASAGGQSAAPPGTDQLPTARLKGRLQIDALLVHEGATKSTGTQVRRAQLGVEGRFSSRLRYQAVAEFAGARVALEDTFLAYRASPSTELFGGYLKPPITSDELTSDLYTLFIERSAFAGTFAPGRRVGLGLAHAGKDWGLRGGLFGERDDALLDGRRSEGWLATGRVHADLLPGEAVLHTALSAYHSRIGSDREARLSQRPESNRAPAVLDTGAFAARHGSFAGGELGFGQGPLTVQAEGGLLRFGGGPADPTFRGFSAQIGWRITGEDRPYDAKTGVFGRIVPEGSLGALEAGLRLTHVDLEDDGIQGGRLTTYGAVLNWYPVERLRIAANIIHASVAGTGSQEDKTLLTLRGGVDW